MMFALPCVNIAPPYAAAPLIKEESVIKIVDCNAILIKPPFIFWRFYTWLMSSQNLVFVTITLSTSLKNKLGVLCNAILSEKTQESNLMSPVESTISRPFPLD